MRQKILLLFIALVTLPTVSASAEEFIYSSNFYSLIYEVLDEEAKTCAVKEYNYDDQPRELIIPRTARNNTTGTSYTVTKINKNAFKDCVTMTKITLPPTINEIDTAAFWGCNNTLQEVHISDLDAWCQIDFAYYSSNPIFYAQHLYLNGNELTKLVIPESATVIKPFCFCGLAGLESVTIGDHVTEIDSYAFYDCKRVTSLTIGNSVKRIGSNAFNGCTRLTSVTIPESVTEIDNYAFFNCMSLKSVVIPNSVTTIGVSAFNYCEKMTSVTIGNSVESIGMNAFMNCYVLPSISFPNSVITIGQGVCANCKVLKDITIGASTTSIGKEAFKDCKNVTSVICHAETPPNVDLSSFTDDTYKRATLVVPGSSEEDYQNHPVWTLFTQQNLVDVSSVSLSIDNCTLSEGESFRIIATVLPTNADDKKLTWTSSNIMVASVDANGTVTAKRSGSTTITVTASNGVKATCSVTVKSSLIEITGIKLNVDYEDMIETETIKLIAYLEPENATDQGISWTSSNPLVATVDRYGVVTAVKKGYTVITARTTNDLTATCSINVYAKLIPATELTLNLKDAEIFEESTIQLIATVKPDDTTDKTVTWTTSDPEVATVDEYGLVTGVMAGKATITAKTANGKSAYCTVTVNPKPIEVTRIFLNLEDVEIFKSDVLQLTATIEPDDAADKKITWSSSDTKIVAVDKNGNVTAIAEGTAVITAKASNGLSASCTISVVPKIVEVNRVALNYLTAELIEEHTVQLTATVRPVNATDKTVTWSTSDPQIATVDENGLVTTIKKGTAVITAESANGIKATCTVTVKPTPVDATGVILDMEDADVYKGGTLQLSAAVLPEEATDKTITWSSSDPKIAAVDKNGLVTAIQDGTTTITAKTANGFTATCTIRVTTVIVYATGVTLNVEEAEMYEKDILQLIATVIPSNTTYKTVTWSSSDSKVAAVDRNGLVVAMAEGTATISGKTSNGHTATCTITVIAKPQEDDNFDDTDDDIDDDTDGIEDIAGDKEIGGVKIEGRNIIAPEGSAVYDLNGKPVRTEGLRPGIYIVRTPAAKTVKVRVK